MSKKYSLLAVGELLVDLIGIEKKESLIDTSDFQRFQGGSPSNLAANMARLGGKVALVSTVGNDNLGNFLISEIERTNIESDFISKSDQEPTSIVVVSRTSGTPDFIAYRTADKLIYPQNLPDSLLADSAIFHTTCFALSLEPAQSTIVDAARRASQLGCQVSIDCNYAPSIWPNRSKAWDIIKQFCSVGAFVKLSEDDAERLYAERHDHQYIIDDFHKIGARLVCLTLGSDGAIISSDFGENKFRLFGKKVTVIDATGAGDAFWSGFLTAYLDGHNFEICGQAGTNMAIQKLKNKGPLPEKLNKKILYFK